jgi:hypothetical protein
MTDGKVGAGDRGLPSVGVAQNAKLTALDLDSQNGRLWNNRGHVTLVSDLSQPIAGPI